QVLHPRTDGVAGNLRDPRWLVPDRWIDGENIRERDVIDAAVEQNYAWRVRRKRHIPSGGIHLLDDARLRKRHLAPIPGLGVSVVVGPDGGTGVFVGVRLETDALICN